MYCLVSRVLTILLIDYLESVIELQALSVIGTSYKLALTVYNLATSGYIIKQDFINASIFGAICSKVPTVSNTFNVSPSEVAKIPCISIEDLSLYE